MLTNRDRWVSDEANVLSEDAALTPRANAIVNMFTHPDGWVRLEAVMAFGDLDDAARTSNAGALLGLLTDSDEDVRYVAVCLFASKWALGMLTPRVITVARSAITNLLNDANYSVRDEARYALDNTKKKLVRFHWETARAFVHVYVVRPYALFWYEYTGKQLCAPGGKWAERDRAAFEADFNELHT